jgi:hypothetical protein
MRGSTAFKKFVPFRREKLSDNFLSDVVAFVACTFFMTAVTFLLVVAHGIGGLKRSSVRTAENEINHGFLFVAACCFVFSLISVSVAFWQSRKHKYPRECEDE